MGYQPHIALWDDPILYGIFFGMEYRDGKWRYPAGAPSGWSAYPDLLGVSWKPENIGHAVRHVFTVKLADRVRMSSRNTKRE